MSADATILTLVDATNIYVPTGEEPITPPCLLLDIVTIIPWLDDIDGVYTSEVHFVAFAESEEVALKLAGAVLALTKQNNTTYADASFASNNIQTMGISHLSVRDMAKEQFEPTSVRRTERSDVPVPDRKKTSVPVLIRWRDISA